MVLRKTGCDKIILDLNLILYFDEDQRSFMIVVGFWKTLGVYFFLYIQMILYFGLDYRVVVMLSDFCLI